MSRPLRPDELGIPGPGDDFSELTGALAAARLLEGGLSADGVQPSPDFAARVMAAVAAEPAPRRGVLAGLIGAFRSAWRSALAANQPPLLRARAIAVVLVAILALGSLGGAATLAAASALDLLGPHPSPSPLVSPVPTPGASPSPSTSPRPGVTPEPTELVTPEASETPEPGKTPEASDDHGGGGGGHVGGGGGGSTPRPTETPRSTQTPKPTETPEASDH
jgi:hypothetical protein